MKNIQVYIEVFFLAYLLILFILWLIPPAYYDKFYKLKNAFSPEQNFFKAGWRKILTEKVSFYKNLTPRQKILFEQKILEFINTYKIHGVGIDITDIDKLLVASSGVIPVFSFPTWYYKDLKNIYLYDNSFQIKHPMLPNGTLLNGLVGYGGMKNKMYLSRKALYESFKKDYDGQHTGMDEFLHLIDMEDGKADGIPDILIPKSYIKPWENLIIKEIERIYNENSVLNEYAGVNAAEFFAESGVSFFENPEELKKNHPELYQMLRLIFMNKKK